MSSPRYVLAVSTLIGVGIARRLPAKSRGCAAENPTRASKGTAKYLICMLEASNVKGFKKISNLQYRSVSVSTTANGHGGV